MLIEVKQSKQNIAKITLEHIDAFHDLRDNFSTIEKNFGYIKRCRSKGIKVQTDKEYIKKSCIKMNGEFEIGLLFDILTFCNDKFYNRTLTFKVDNSIKEYIKSNNLTLDTTVYIDDIGSRPRQYQIDSMQIALNKQNGLYILGTGAGKTLCCALLIHNLLKYKLTNKILLICPFPDLAEQTFIAISGFLKDYNYSFSRWFGKHKFDFNSNIIIASSSIIRSQFNEVKSEIEQIDCIIVDEVHQLKADNKISDIIKILPAKFRYGFTGTLPNDKHNEWSIKGKIGPVRYNLPSSELRENKFLTPVEVLGIHIKIDNFPKDIDYSEEVEWLSTSEQFNKTILNISKKLQNNSLILINRLEHGENLKAILENFLEDKKVYFIKGELSIEERNKIKQEMETNNNLIVIAQVSIFSTGINIKNIHNIIFPGLIGKSNIRVIQSIGRALRLQADKKLAQIIDLVPSTKYCTRHWEERKKIYEKEKINYKELNIAF